MSDMFFLENQHVHIWKINLQELSSHKNQLSEILSPDEIERANRLRFDEHRARFIIARGILRHILSAYTQIPPQEIAFSYGKRGKPYLLANPQNLQFNISHSQDLAVVALTKNYDIGIDIEKIKEPYNPGLVERFFSPAEFLAFNKLETQSDRMHAFYQLWAAKEALIKADGEGLNIPLDEFTVSLEQKSQWVSMPNIQKPADFYLEHVHIDDHYQCAYATNQTVKNIIYGNWR